MLPPLPPTPPPSARRRAYPPFLPPAAAPLGVSLFGPVPACRRPDSCIIARLRTPCHAHSRAPLPSRPTPSHPSYLSVAGGCTTYRYIRTGTLRPLAITRIPYARLSLPYRLCEDGMSKAPSFALRAQPVQEFSPSWRLGRWNCSPPPRPSARYVHAHVELRDERSDEIGLPMSRARTLMGGVPSVPPVDMSH